VEVELGDIKPFVDALMTVGNLDVNQAKTLVYYCIMTWSDEPKIRPIVDLNGESGTGKNGIMKQLKPWCRGAKWINARSITSAQLRDELADTQTAFVEEADKTKDPKESENWYQNRYEDTGRDVSYRRQFTVSRGGHTRSLYRQETHNHFGYTLLHTQNPFQTAEMDRRTLRITLYKDHNRSYRLTEGLDDTILLGIADEVDWGMEIERTTSGSAWDVWLPLMKVATHLRDSEFMEYARGQIEAKAEEDSLTKLYEPKGLVLSEIAPQYLQGLNVDKNKLPITEVRQSLYQRGYQYDERQIVKLAKDLGFTIVKPHNKAHVKFLSRQQLDDILERAGVSGDFYEEGTPEEVTGSIPLVAECP
jgi:hypothetical protein